MGGGKWRGGRPTESGDLVCVLNVSLSTIRTALGEGVSVLLPQVTALGLWEMKSRVSIHTSGTWWTQNTSRVCPPLKLNCNHHSSGSLAFEGADTGASRLEVNDSPAAAAEAGLGARLEGLQSRGLPGITPQNGTDPARQGRVGNDGTSYARSHPCAVCRMKSGTWGLEQWRQPACGSPAPKEEGLR